jgi:hypothetical protein
MSRENTPIRRTRIAATGNEVLASEHDTTELDARVMKSTGAASESMSGGVIERVSEMPHDDEHTAMLAFMAEPIEVRIAETSDPEAEQIFEITINGRTELFRRGETKTVPRYYIDRMARLKETRYTNREVVSADGTRDVVYDPRTSLKYDFAITRDTNPLGASWHRAVLLERA